MNLDRPDATVRFSHLTANHVTIGDSTVARIRLEPGWRWSEHVRPEVGGDWCQARHVGVVLSGRFAIRMSDGATFEFGPNDVFEVPSGHDGWTVGDEPCIQIEWQGLRAFAGHRLMGGERRVLVTLLFTDIVDSTSTAASLGDVAWLALLSAHYETSRGIVERYGGHEVSTTGDGQLATFESPAPALHCASEIRRAAKEAGIAIRASVHVGEVERVGHDVRGIAVHEAARIMSAAAPNEVLVSATTRALARGARLDFAAAGNRELKGLDGEWELFAFRDSADTGRR